MLRLVCGVGPLAVGWREPQQPQGSVELRGKGLGAATAAGCGPACHSKLPGRGPREQRKGIAADASVATRSPLCLLALSAASPLVLVGGSGS